MPAPAGRCAVLLAHPGHELVIHGFVERMRPLVAVLTDGSGSTGVSRVASTTRVLETIGAQPGDFYGRYTDRQLYSALLAGDHELFIGIAEELADVLLAAEIDTVVGDASEGWNPIHDVWRSVIDAAVELASQRRARAIRNYDFLLFASHHAAAAHGAPGAMVMQLDEAAYARKLASSNSYPELHGEVQAAMSGSTAAIVHSRALAAELDRRLGDLSAESYRTELLRPVAEAPRHPAMPRVFELYGELLVAAGRYEEPIRYDRHLAPVEAALRQHACASSSAIRI